MIFDHHHLHAVAQGEIRYPLISGPGPSGHRTANRRAKSSKKQRCQAHGWCPPARKIWNATGCSTQLTV